MRKHNIQLGPIVPLFVAAFLVACGTPDLPSDNPQEGGGPGGGGPGGGGFWRP